jgi:hypothetical protein
MVRTAETGKTGRKLSAESQAPRALMISLTNVQILSSTLVPVFPVLPILPTCIMKPPTDYIRHAARLARKLQMDSAMGGTPQPDAEFYKILSKAFDEIAAGLELVGKPD